MSTIDVAHALRLIIIFREEERRVGVIGGVVKEQLVDRAQKPLRLMPSDSALAAQIRLQIGHKESAGNSLPCDVAQHQPHPILTQVEEVIIVATHLRSLNADARVIQRSEGRKSLWKESGLHLPGNL